MTLDQLLKSFDKVALTRAEQFDALLVFAEAQEARIAELEEAGRILAKNSVGIDEYYGYSDRMLCRGCRQYDSWYKRPSEPQGFTKHLPSCPTLKFPPKET